MTEYVMPEPPKGMHWVVDRHHMIGTLNLMKVKLCWDKRPFWEPRCWDSREGYWSADPELNAFKAVKLAEKILDTWRENQCNVNGLQGAKLGYGVTGNG